MADWKLATPVAFIIFNRPDTTARVFAEIAKAKPPVLLVVADGPRANRSGEAEKCKLTRAIIEQVDWDCKVLTNYSDSNLGCKNRVSSGLDWVFNTVEEAIILEDDCLPHPSFFRFCEEMLLRYRNDERIGHIGGVNFQNTPCRTDQSYYYSRFNHVWGWASWRRAWNSYDVQLSLWPEVRDKGWLKDLLRDSNAIKFWTRIFDSVAKGNIDTWDYQWTFACLVNSRMTVLPTANLISNIGYGADATHTTRDSALANVPVKELTFPLKHPTCMAPDARADARTAQHVYGISTLGLMKSAIGRIPPVRRAVNFVRQF